MYFYNIWCLKCFPRNFCKQISGKKNCQIHKEKVSEHNVISDNI